ncbi:MAG: PEP-CTERM sorting domain-containing protein [Tepidisphaeraceae bacterium]
MRFTYYGDADLNGVVNLNDFDDWLYGYTGGTGTAGDVNWSVGDFAYTGHVDLNDFDLWLASYTSGDGSLNTLDHAIDVSTLSTSQKTELLDIVASVPEPTSVGVLGIAGVGLLRRRRRGVGGLI